MFVSIFGIRYSAPASIPRWARRIRRARPRRLLMSRQAISHAMPREQIVQQIASGYGNPGTVPIPWSSPEYDHQLLKPIEYDLDLSRKYMEQAGYTY